jgi:uncharacterized protein (UPF0264 family)
VTRLLVSVRDVAEADAALVGGADLIDLKEPSLGSLAAVSSTVAAAVAERIGSRCPLSMALGELCDSPDARPIVPSRVTFAKLGLTGAASLTDWRGGWRREFSTLPDKVGRVAVIYADWQSCDAPAPDDVLELADEERCAAVLLDTFGKTAGDVFSYFADGELRQLAARVHAIGAQFVLAGSLRMETIGRAAEISPDYVAVRGAACQGPRTGAIDAARVRQLKKLLSRTAAIRPTARALA